MTDGIVALTEVTKEKIEHDREQQRDLMQMVLEAALKNNPVGTFIVMS